MNIDLVMEYATFGIWGIVFLFVIFKFIRSIRIVPTKIAFIVERLGKYHKTLGPGFHALMPFFDKVAFIHHQKEETIDIPPQECFTLDNVKVAVDGVMYIAVSEPEQASYGITDYRLATVQLAQTTVRSVIGTLELDRCFEERDVISAKVVGALSEAGIAWGIKVFRYEIQNIVPPASVKEAMEKQVSAERNKRATISESEGVKQSRINRSEGVKMELINTSEGEKAKLVNEAQGKAQAIKAIAEATAVSIEQVGEQIATEHGLEAIKMLVSQKYLTQIGGLAKKNTEIILPADLTKFNELLDTLGLEKKET
jgi:regulator of protease activity HflC (stomatin/prohibitin superfamily)